MRILKPIKRELTLEAAFGKHAGRQIKVELLPGDYLAFVLKGTRQRVEVSLSHCYNLALIVTMNKIYQDRLAQYEVKKKAGYRVKKPKKPVLPYDPTYFKALSQRAAKRIGK